MIIRSTHNFMEKQKHHVNQTTTKRQSQLVHRKLPQPYGCVFRAPKKKIPVDSHVPKQWEHSKYPAVK